MEERIIYWRKGTLNDLQAMLMFLSNLGFSSGPPSVPKRLDLKWWVMGQKCVPLIITGFTLPVSVLKASGKSSITLQKSCWCENPEELLCFCDLKNIELMSLQKSEFKLLPNANVSLAWIAHSSFLVQTIYCNNTGSQEMSGSDIKVVVWKAHSIT